MAAAALLTLVGAVAPAHAAPGDIPRPPGANPDGRGWELVSPVDKNGGDIYFVGSSVKSAASGDGVAYVSPVSFAGGGASAPRTSDYIARRGAAGWTTENITQPNAPDVLGALLSIQQSYRWFSDDLELAVAMRNDDPATLRNLYRRDFRAGTNVLMMPAPLVTLAPWDAVFEQPAFVDASDDGSHILFESRQKLTPDAPEPSSVPSLYEWVDGQVTLAGILPSGLPATGSVGARGQAADADRESRAHRVMTRDGSRYFFTEPIGPPKGSDGFFGEVYLREDGQTLHVSASQRTDCAGDPSCGGDGEPDPVADPLGPGEVQFITASDDGSQAFLQSCRKLTDDSRATCGGGSEPVRMGFYRYDRESGDLEDLTADEDFTPYRVIDASADGSYLYFTSGGTFDRIAHVWHDGEVREIGPASARAEVNDYPNIATVGEFPRASRVSADGRYLLYLRGNSELTREQLYLYDAEADSSTCVSCSSSGDPYAWTASTVGRHPGGGVLNVNQYEPRVMDDAGTRVFFETDAPLVPEDRNGRIDVYQYDVASGKRSLVSSGGGNSDAHLGDVSPDASSVFIVTGNRLVGDDVDDSRDLYVARVGGGVPEPAPTRPGCEGDACQAPPTTGSDRPAPGSSGLRGRGDVRPAARPRVAIAGFTARQRAAIARRGRLVVGIRVNRPGRVSLSVSRKAGSVGRASKVARRAGRVRLAVSLPRSARRDLAEGRRMRLTLSVRFAGDVESRTITIERKAGK